MEEIREILEINYCNIQYVDQIKQTNHLKQIHNAADQKWDETFTL